MNRKNIQRALFLAILANCCLVIVITSVALSTENWVIVRPYRQQPAEFPSTNIKLNKEDVLSVLMNHKHNSSLPYSVINETLFKANILLKDKNDTDYLLDISGLSEELDDEDDVLPIDLYATKDCVRYKGKIKLGLFKGVWLLNYAFGCKNRINRVSIIDMLIKYKIFDITLWISCVLSCSLALFSILLAGVFTILNVFMSPSTAMHGPIGLYLWLTVSLICHLLALLMYALEFHMYIQKNVLTKDEQESGWISTDKAELGWSYFILIASTILVTINLALVYTIEIMKRSSLEPKSYLHDEACPSLIAAESGRQSVQRGGGGDEHTSELDASLNERVMISSSSKSRMIRRIIDFIY